MGGNLDKLFEHAPTPMYLLSRSGQIEWMNQVARELFGVKTGMNYLVAVASVSHRAARTAFIGKAFGTRPETHTRGFLRGKTGEDIPVEIHAITVRDGSGMAFGVFGIIELDPKGPLPAKADFGERLTPRQHQVLDLLSLGYSTERIADELCVAIDTVRNHMRGVFRALGVNSRVEALAALRRVDAEKFS